MVPCNLTLWYQIKRYGITVQTWRYDIVIRRVWSAQLYHNAMGSGGLKEPCITLGPDPTVRRSNF